MLQNILSGLTETTVTEVIDKRDKAILGDVQTLKMFVWVLDSLRLGVLREIRLFLATVQVEATATCSARLKVIHLTLYSIIYLRYKIPKSGFTTSFKKQN